MALSDDASDEIEALEAIFVDDFERIGENTVSLRIAPDFPEEGQACRTASLEVGFPGTYPADEGPRLRVLGGEGLDTDAIASMQAVAEAEAAANVGAVVVFGVTEALKAWLWEHTRYTPEPAPAAPVVPAVEEVEAEGSDFDVDSEDLDDEMVEALQEVLAMDAAKVKELRKIKRMTGKEQRTALRGVLKALTPAQREVLIGSDSDDSEEEARPAARGKAAAKAAPVKLPPAVIDCADGHELGAFSARPPDYKKFDGDTYTCDVCGRDANYRNGVYHCAKCFAKGGKQWDACPSCGTQVKSAKSGKSQKGGHGGKKK